MSSLPTNISRRRQRSAEWCDDIAHLRDLNARVQKYSRLFSNLVQENQIYADSDLQFEETTTATAHNNSFVDIEFRPNDIELDLLTILKTVIPNVRGALQTAWGNSPFGGVVFTLSATAKYYALIDPEKHATTDLNSGFYEIYQIHDLLDVVKAAMGDIMQKNEEYQHGRSDWIFDKLIYLTLRYHFKKPSRAANGGGGIFAQLSKKKGKGYIVLPKWVVNKKCVLNIKNTDDYCFKYCMEAAYVYLNEGSIPKNGERVNKYPDIHFNYGDLTFPIGILDLEKFEHLNVAKHNLALYVFTASNKEQDIGILYTSKNYDPCAWEVCLLLIDDEKNDVVTNTHWCFITKPHQFLSSRILNNGHKSKFFCFRCAREFSTETKRYNHTKDCRKNNDVARPILPYEYQKYKCFTDFHKMNVQPFVTYADFEAFNTPVTHKLKETTTEKNLRTEHVAASYCYHTVCRFDPQWNKTEIFSYDKDNIEDKFLVGRKFIEAIDAEKLRCEWLNALYFNHRPNGEPEPYDDSTCCGICKLNLKRGSQPHWYYTNGRRQSDFLTPKEFQIRKCMMRKTPLVEGFRNILYKENKEPTVLWDYTRENDNVLGWTHKGCTRKRPGYEDFKYQHIVLFHNLIGYDAHFILKSLNPGSLKSVKVLDSLCRRKQIEPDNWTYKFSGIPQSGDKFMSFSYRGIKFIDSMKFMMESLDKLTTNLLKSGTENFHNFNSFPQFQQYDEETKALLLQKGIFPYDWFSHPKVFSEVSLPDECSFYNKLRQEEVKSEDYSRAQLVWNKTQCKTFRDYHDLYLYVDVLLLADIFENFRTICLKQDQLDPLNYISLPGYAMDSAFIFSGKRSEGGQSEEHPFFIELFTSDKLDMYQFIEDSIRGGVSMTPGRYCKANHPFMDDYDEKKDPSSIFYLDANNLYGYAMNQPLPSGGYEWVKEKHMQKKLDELVNMFDQQGTGYIFEIDGYFPICKDKTHMNNCTCNHDYLSDFPPAPVKGIVDECKISPLMKEMNERYANEHDGRTEKLLCTLESKTNYKVYYKTLQLYQKLGFVVTKVHRILKFRQTAWLSEYINFNTAQRAIATSAFEKDFYKLKNNSVYGKFIQNNRKFKNCKVLPKFNPEKKSTYPYGLRDWRIVNENFVLGYLHDGRVRLNSPVIVGSVILDHAKHLMYNFYYNVMKKEFDSNVKLLFTDTDSLCMQIKHPYPMKHMYDKGIIKEWFDCSEYPKDESYYGYNFFSNENKKVIGKFKDEMVEGGKGEYILETVAIRSKMYSCLSSGDHDKIRAKGVSGVAKRLVKHQQFLECVNQSKDFKIEKSDTLRFQSVNNVINTVNINKSLLSPCDTKLYLVDNHTTKPYGHYSILDLSIPS